MNTSFNVIGKRGIARLVIAMSLCVSNYALAQQPHLRFGMLFPPRNYEMRLGDTITPRVRIWNGDTLPSAPVMIYFRIRNVVTGITTHSDSLRVSSVAPADSIDLTFAPYPTNPNILSQLGTFNACLHFAPGDSICTRLFGVRRTTQPFRDPSDNYSKTHFADIPDQTIWISLGTTVVDGEDSTWDPPPPRNIDGAGNGPDSLHSPVLRLDRIDERGNFYTGDGVGDTLMSFPINIMGQTRLSLTMDFMRGGRHRYPLNWDASSMLGPEQTITDGFGRVVRPGDSLVIEFKKPTEPGTNPSPNGWDEIAAIDGGHDFEFKPLYAYLYTNSDTTSLQVTLNGQTKTFVNVPNYFTSDFRIRFRLKAKNDAPLLAPPTDDADAWYIDNPTVVVPLIPNLEVLWVKVVNPYTKVPASQTNFPIFVNIHGGYGWNTLPFRVIILNPRRDTLYSQVVGVDGLGNGLDTTIRFPNWDASGEWDNGGAAYTAKAYIYMPGLGYDDYPDDDEAETRFFLNIESGDQSVQEFALDHAGVTPAPGSGNDMPLLLQKAGAGIGFNGTTGSYAMKFVLARRDSVYGVRVYFGNANQAPDHIRISLLRGDSTSCIPLDTVGQLGLSSTFVDIRKGGFFNQFWPYYFPKPIVLEKGIYWVAVSQLSKYNMELGGDLSRGGGEIVRGDNDVPQITSIYGPASSVKPWYGTQWGSGPADNNGDVSCSFAMETPAGSGLWQPMMSGYGWWPAMTPADEMTPLLHVNNIMSNLDVPPWTGAGTFLPMIRPLVGQRIDVPYWGTVSISDSGAQSQLQTFPNPFDPSMTETTISYALTHSGPTTLTVCNMLGVTLKTLVNSTMGDGLHFVSWDGKTNDGNPVPNGTYLISLMCGGYRATAKMVVTRMN